MIGELITKKDNFERVQDRLAEILALEIANQNALAGGPASPWDIRVFVDSQLPFESFFQGDERPLVNILFSRVDTQGGSSSVVNEVTCEGEYYLDVYGFGVAEETEAGHDPSDYLAAQSAKSAFRVVRNIIMAGEHTTLGLGGTVVQRRLVSFESLTPPGDIITHGSVHVIRGLLRVRFSEETPQVQGQPIELASISVSNNNGQLLAGDEIIYPLGE
jgi:hypothetical protein